MLEYAPLIAQAVLAVVGLRELRRHVYPAVSRLHHPTLVIDIWAPLIAALPLVLVGARLAETVRGTGFVPVGGPVCAGWMALAVAAVLGFGRRSEAEPPSPFMVVTWSVTGLFLLLVGAVNVLEIWIGQCAFAALAVLLWINAPTEHEATGETPPQAAMWRAGVGVLVAVVASIGQGVTVWLTDADLLPIAGAMLLAYSIMAVGSASVAGPNAAVRIGGWTATYGVLLTTGLLSLAKLVPAVLGIAAGNRVPVITDVAEGFGTFAPEAAALLVLGPTALLVLRAPGWLTRIGGAVVIVAVAIHITWRLGAA